MPPFVSRSILYGSVAVLGLTGIRFLQTAPDPADLLAQAKAASGGRAWDGVRSLHIRYALDRGKLKGTEEDWQDVRTGRFSSRYSLPPRGGGSGFDGVSFWVLLVGGYSYVRTDEDTRLGAANESYQASLAYWYPERHPATLAYSGEQREGDRTFDVVSVTPQGGRPFQIWIDRQTRLIDRFVEQQAEDVQIARFSDYRPEGGVLIPRTQTVGNADPQWDHKAMVESVEVNAPLAPEQFAIPPEPKPDYEFLNGKTSTTVPFRLVDDDILIPVRINGQGPFVSYVDSGGSYIVQPALAKRLHLQSAGALRTGGGGEGYVTSGQTIVDQLDIGDVRLKHQIHSVLTFDPDVPEASMVGLQLLKRFVVRIDFDRKLLTLTRPDKFTYRGDGAIVPFHFQSNQPEVFGSVDGIAGTFCIDTGDAGSGLLLIAPFVRRYGLVEQYGATIPYGGSAIGGSTYGLLTRVKRLSLFGADGRPAITVASPLTRLSQQKRGFDADAYVSGNVGIPILKQFNVTFDYDRHRIIFEKNKNYGQFERYNRTGFAATVEGDIWKVARVFPKSPAADAGMKEGDLILTINGQTPKQLVGLGLYQLSRGKVGDKMKLRLQAGGATRDVELTLRDVL